VFSTDTEMVGTFTNSAQGIDSTCHDDEIQESRTTKMMRRDIMTIHHNTAICDMIPFNAIEQFASRDAMR